MRKYVLPHEYIWSLVPVSLQIFMQLNHFNYVYTYTYMCKIWELWLSSTIVSWVVEYHNLFWHTYELHVYHNQVRVLHSSNLFNASLDLCFYRDTRFHQFLIVLPQQKQIIAFNIKKFNWI